MFLQNIFHITRRTNILESKFSGKVFNSPSDNKMQDNFLWHFSGEKGHLVIWTIGSCHLSHYITSQSTVTNCSINVCNKWTVLYCICISKLK